MNILAIGDINGKLDEVKKIPVNNIDLIILTGDIGNPDLARAMFSEKVKNKHLDEEYWKSKRIEAYAQTKTSAIETVKYLASISPTIIVYGNVETTPHLIGDVKSFAEETNFTSELESINNVKVLRNDVLDLKEVKIGGIEYFLDKCWIEEFMPKNSSEEYARRMDIATNQSKKVEEALERFKSVDILVSHLQPYGILDRVNSEYVPSEWKGKHAGSKIITRYIESHGPKIVLSSHIHESKGTETLKNITIYNLGLLGYKTIDTKHL